MKLVPEFLGEQEVGESAGGCKHTFGVSSSYDLFFFFACAAANGEEGDENFFFKLWKKE